MNFNSSKELNMMNLNIMRCDKITIKTIKNYKDDLNDKYYIKLLINNDTPQVSKIFSLKSKEIIFNQSFPLDTFGDKIIKIIKIDLYKTKEQKPLCSAIILNQNFVLDNESGDYIIKLNDEKGSNIIDIYYSIEYIAIDSFEMFDKSVKLNESEKKNLRKKNDMTLSTNENIKTEFIQNLIYVQEIIDIFSRIKNWDNIIDTLLFLLAISLIILYFKLIFIYLIPLPIIFFHMKNKSKLNDFLNNKENPINKRRNDLFYISLQDKYNNLIEGYENFIKKIIVGKNSTIIEIYKALIIAMILNIFLFHYNFFYIIKWRKIVVFFIWKYFLSNNPYCVKFFKIILELFSPFYSQISDSLSYNQIISVMKHIFSFFIPFYPLYNTIKENNSDIYISLVKSQGLKPSSSKNILKSSKSLNYSNNLIKFELYENERWWVISGWTKKLIGKRPTWCRVNNPYEFCDKSNIFLPNDEDNTYQWSADWKIVKNENTDNSGWEYADNFDSQFGKNEKLKYVRRRKWVRYANKI
jgi:hypothetical protein